MHISASHSRVETLLILFRFILPLQRGSLKDSCPLDLAAAVFLLIGSAHICSSFMGPLQEKFPQKVLLWPCLSPRPEAALLCSSSYKEFQVKQGGQCAYSSVLRLATRIQVSVLAQLSACLMHTKDREHQFCVSELTSWHWGCPGEDTLGSECRGRGNRDLICQSAQEKLWWDPHIPSWMESACGKTVLLAISYLPTDI